MNAIKKIVMGLAVACAAVFCSAADIYVATTGHDDTGDGSSGNPYATIAKGIAAAKTAGGGMVYVADSETAYATPNATLDAAIAVVGNPEHPENVVIDDATAGERAFTLSHADAKVAGVTITGTGYQTGDGSGGHISMSAGTVEDCIIEGGRAAADKKIGKGGNVFMSGGCLRRCIVRNGKAADSTSNGNCRGANIYATGGVVENCLVTGGSAQTQGQSSFDVDGATVRVVNCTIVGNSYTGTATASIFSGLHVLNDKAQVVNCVIYDNGGTAAKEWGNARAARFINCAVASGAAISGGTGNIDTVTEDAFKDYANGDYRPVMGVLVDAGVSENDYVNTYGATSMADLAGGVRVIRDNLDIGAYEFQQGGFLAGGGASIYSTGTGNPVTFTAMSVGAEGEVSYLWDFGDGTTSGWTTEATVTHAYALTGDHVVSVKAKTEEQGESAAFILPHGAIHTVPADICVDSENGNDETGDGTSEKPLATLATAYALAKNSHGELAWNVTVHLADGTYDAANMALNVPFAVVGNADDPSQVTINDATAGERAFTLSHADAKVAGVTITGAGYQTGDGSGGHIDMSAGTVEDCIIEGGRAAAEKKIGKGGNVSMSGGCLRRCIVRNGKVADSTSNGNCRGANIYATGGVVENCLVTGGSAQTQSQSSLDVDGATVRVVNCTIVGNSHTSTATVSVFSGIHVFNDKAQVVNCVIYDNGGTAAKEWGNANPTKFINCAFAAGLAPATDTACIDTVKDTAFKAYTNGDYRPASDSVLKGAGVTKSEYNTYGAISETDLIGTLWGKTLDIGCYAVAKSAGLMLILR